VNETLQAVLTIGTPIAAIALSYGGIRSMVKSLQKDFSDLSNKVTALENSKATTSQFQALEAQVATTLRQLDMKIAAADAVRAQHEVTLATLKASHEELQRKHNEGSAELRNRATALEGRTSSVEQGAAELRAQMNAVVQAVARVEAKQDREASALEQIRRDLLEFVVNPNRR
jgi:predicted  nucleic acid-binding Zn-ribbon protein